MRRFRVVGRGRAGSAFALALDAAGWSELGAVGRGDDPVDAARDVDLVILGVPDTAIASVAGRIEPRAETLIVHLAGSLGPDVLALHPRRAAVHPLVSLPTGEIGAQRLRGAWFAVAGDRAGAEVVEALGGRSFAVEDADRAAYHAAACIASNHLVALLGQVERIASSVGVPFDAYLELARGSLDNVAALGCRAALTGPAARGDDATLERHRAALDASELAAYDAMVGAARRLARADG